MTASERAARGAPRGSEASPLPHGVVLVPGGQGSQPQHRRGRQKGQREARCSESTGKFLPPPNLRGQGERAVLHEKPETQIFRETS